MPTYFFNVRSDRGLTRDHEGSDLPDPNAARFEALTAGKLMVAERMRGGRRLADALSPSFEIEDEKGQIVLTVSFKEGAEADDHRP